MTARMRQLVQLEESSLLTNEEFVAAETRLLAG
jgi:hypothetical protein